MNRATRRQASRDAARAPRHLPRRDRGHVMTPRQVEQLVMPIHIAIELLPLGLYTEQHAHDLAAFLNVAQFAANEAGRDDIHAETVCGVRVLMAMRDRARAGKAWNVTHDERTTLLRTVNILDCWHRTQTNTRWERAMRRVIEICDRAMAQGRRELDVMEVA